MVIFNLDTNRFEIYSNQDYFLAIQIDQERSDLKEVVHHFYRAGGMVQVTPLNNEYDDSLEKCLEMFSQENKNFIMFLDYYRLDNQHLISKILNLKK